MKGTKTEKLNLDSSGYFLGREEGCLFIRDFKGNKRRFPLNLNTIGQIEIRSGNAVSSGALVTCCYFGIDLIVETARGHAVGVLVGLDNSSHVLNRLAQYEAFASKRSFDIAKAFLIGKLKGQDCLLSKYGLRRLDPFCYEQVKNAEAKSLSSLRHTLTNIEGRCAYQYFQQVFSLLPEFLRPKNRTTFKAYDRTNNLLDLAYTVLSWHVHVALIKAKLEPFHGFLHSVQFGKPSLVCDFMEIYRYLIDDFIFGFCKDLSEKNFVLKEEAFSNSRKGKRQYLNKVTNDEFLKSLSLFFRSKVEIPRIKVGKRQEVETLISEEALLFAKYLREEIPAWNPRLPTV